MFKEWCLFPFIIWDLLIIFGFEFSKGKEDEVCLNLGCKIFLKIIFYFENISKGFIFYITMLKLFKSLKNSNLIFFKIKNTFKKH